MSRFHVHRPLALITLVLTGCASTALPTARVASTEAAIRSAQETGADTNPQAALHLHYARLERGEADRLAHNGNQDRAVMQLRRSEADADLAIALTRQAQAERQTSEAAAVLHGNTTVTAP